MGRRPLGRSCAVQPGQQHQGERAVVTLGRLRELLQDLRAVLAGFARGHAHLDQLLVGKQAERAATGQHRAPVEMGAGGGVHCALGVALLARRLANDIAQLLHQQRLVSVHRVQAFQPALQVLPKLRRADLHVALRPAPPPGGA